MNNKILYLASLALLPISAFSAPTVTFEGEVTTQTCSVNVNGSTNSIVLLPTVSTSDFGTTLTTGQTAGLTPFTITVSGCAPSTTAAQPITTKFLGYNVDTASGVLGNIATTSTPASGFGIQLTKDNTGSSAVKLNGLTPVSGLSLAVGQTSASYEFGAQYYVINATGATPGKVTSVTEYTISYL
ncbi:type 1 fimbrial protein [Rosenbergiella australiborealis]|uniref:Type 1 fimbrial protein n=1 Tax=Rosenbergiella australiborealis TaxID=1544696 RepID=A0ABS5T5J9_9GAMM|nr:fimbrial protein [Rosenbergiella australiborealis]MBT0727621.1 type 1 fimbrial protein [Rosenbergiella australiborealis]